MSEKQKRTKVEVPAKYTVVPAGKSTFSTFVGETKGADTIYELRLPIPQDAETLKARYDLSFEDAMYVLTAKLATVVDSSAKAILFKEGYSAGNHVAAQEFVDAWKPGQRMPRAPKVDEFANTVRRLKELGQLGDADNPRNGAELGEMIAKRLTALAGGKRK